jgi:glycosyltransferase involved in cell wall biosynthesis
VREQITALGLIDRVLRPGRVAATDLDVLYREAAVMAFPSLYEGFGLPLLEAMVRGCPVVASSVGGLPEVGGTAVRLVDPVDIDGWVAALTEVLDDPGYRSTMVTDGLEQSARFRWSRSAVALAELYRELPRNRAIAP